jgi:hypothetical protein
VHAVWRHREDEDHSGVWEHVAVISAYRFRVGVEGWRQFTEELGVDANSLQRGGYQGQLLDLCSDNICKVNITAEEVQGYLERVGDYLERMGDPAEEPVTPEDLAHSWEQQFKQVLRK